MFPSASLSATCSTFLSAMAGRSLTGVPDWSTRLSADGVVTVLAPYHVAFPIKMRWAVNSTALENAGFGISNIRPDVVAGCGKKAGGGSTANWFNENCFAAPPAWGYGTEDRVDPTLRAPGINNFDFAIFKRVVFRERYGIEFRTEFFNLFNHPQFAPPGTGFNGTPTGTGNNGFGQITSDNGDANPRLIQFALKFKF